MHFDVIRFLKQLLTRCIPTRAGQVVQSVIIGARLSRAERIARPAVGPSQARVYLCCGIHFAISHIPSLSERCGSTRTSSHFSGPEMLLVQPEAAKTVTWQISSIPELTL
jgi:hypothetical protein